jgi:hypothetical protein
VKNLVVEVDAKYIKGMINNPDIQPNATINRWISAILLFDFRLRHVPGHAHGPDGLSRRPQAPEDPTISDDYDEWIDSANSFTYENTPSTSNNYNIYGWAEHTNTFAIELINAPYTSYHHSGTADTYLASTSPPLPTTIPRSEKARAKDLELKRLTEFLTNPQWRNGIDAEELRTLVKKASGFFVADGRLWKKDYKAKHKLVIDEDKRLDLLRQVHDDLGHKGIFTTWCGDHIWSVRGNWVNGRCTRLLICKRLIRYFLSLPSTRM